MPTSFLLRDSCPVVDIMSFELNSPIPVHFSSWFLEWFLVHSCHLLFDHFQFALIHGPNIPGSYAILFFTASDFSSIPSHIHNWVLFLLWLYLFILSGVISPLISSSILGTYWPGEFIFQCPIFLPFHTVHWVLGCHVGPSKMDGWWWRVLTKCNPLEKGMANHFSILALRIPRTCQI